MGWRSFAILKDLCSKCGIRLERTDDLALLHDAMESVLEDLGGNDGTPNFEQLQSLIETLMLMTDGELAQMSPGMVDMLCDLGEIGEIPEMLLKRLNKLKRR